jgi:hypothetical protein
VVPVERIRLATETVTGEEVVTEQVRKEQVEVLTDLPPREDAPTAQETETVTTSELFLAPREAEASEDTTQTSQLFIAPREDEPKG